jgi:hypothetical protein
MLGAAGGRRLYRDTPRDHEVPMATAYSIDLRQRVIQDPNAARDSERAKFAAPRSAKRRTERPVELEVIAELGWRDSRTQSLRTINRGKLFGQQGSRHWTLFRTGALRFGARYGSLGGRDDHASRVRDRRKTLSTLASALPVLVFAERNRCLGGDRTLAVLNLTI